MSTLGKAKIVYSRDPAIDKSNPGAVAKALEHTNGTREVGGTGEVNGLPLKNGKQPAIWHIQSLTMHGWAEHAAYAHHEVFSRFPARMSQLMDESTFDMDRVAVKHGLIAVEGAVDLDGRPITLEFEETRTGKVLNEKTLEALFNRFRPTLITELGKHIFRISDLDPL